MRTFNPTTCERLFHGTSEDLVDDLRPGAYDGLFWTAENSAVAQSYIPSSGGSTFCSVPSFQLSQTVRPSKSDPFYTIAKSIGPAPQDADVTWDRFGRATSWRVPDGAATYLDVAKHIESVLGYENKGIGGDKTYELQTDGWNAQTQEHRIVAANFKRPGSLVIATGFEGMRFLDISQGDPDLTDVQYHSHKLFAQAREQGFDGVVIDDFCQTKTWGNVGHRSVGFFDHAVARLKTTIIPVVRFEWGPTSADLQVVDTPEFTAWHLAQKAQRVAREAPDSSSKKVALVA
jgi:hypothetical protein